MANRRVGGKVFNVFYVIVRQTVRWLAGICIIILAVYYKDFENKMGGQNDPEQIELIETVIDNAIEEFTIYDFNEDNDSKDNTNVNDNTLIDNTVVE